MPPQLLGVNSHCPRDLFSHASPSTEIMYFLIGNQPICLHYYLSKFAALGYARLPSVLIVGCPTSTAIWALAIFKQKFYLPSLTMICLGTPMLVSRFAPNRLAMFMALWQAVPHTPLALCASRDDSYLTPQGLHLFASPLIGNLSREYGSSHYYQ